VQNSIRHEDMGAGTAAVTFFRTLGGAVGSAVLGAVLIEQVRTTGLHYVRVYGPTEGQLQAFTHGMTTAFRYTVPVAAVAFALSFLLRDVRLKTAVDGPESTGEASAADGAVNAVVGTAPDGGANGRGGQGPSPAGAGVPAATGRAQQGASLEPPGL
jgi:hypothetical protein